MLISFRRLARRALGTAATLCIVLLLTLSASEAKAISCSPAKNYLGYEYVALAGPNTAGEYFYRMAPIRCQGGQIVFEPSVGATGVTDAGWQLHGRAERWVEIAAEWEARGRQLPLSPGERRT